MKNNRYPVNDIYYTIQGEGVQTGVPAVFLRLHGCSVACSFCDTKETWHFDEKNERDTWEDIRGATPHYTYKAGSEINAYIVKHFRQARWVVVTGGEPAQYPLKTLVTALHDGGFKVAIETSGTETGHIDADFDWITISPKMHMPGGKKMNPTALSTADEIKHVVGTQADINRLQGLLSCVTLKEDCTICLQPMSQSKKATDICITECQKHNYRLSVQTHKYIQIA